MLPDEPRRPRAYITFARRRETDVGVPTGAPRVVPTVREPELRQRRLDPEGSEGRIAGRGPRVEWAVTSVVGARRGHYGNPRLAQRPRQRVERRERVVRPPGEVGVAPLPHVVALDLCEVDAVCYLIHLSQQLYEQMTGPRMSDRTRGLQRSRSFPGTVETTIAVPLVRPIPPAGELGSGSGSTRQNRGGRARR